MAINKVHPDMISPTVVKTTDKAGADSGGTSGQVVQLTASNKVATGYLDTGTTDGNVVLAGGSNKIATSLIDTGLTDGKIVQMITGDKLPAVNGSLLTSIIEALPAGAPLQIQSTLLAAVPQDDLDDTETVNGSTFYRKKVTGLSQSITPVRAGSSFKIEVMWVGSLALAPGTNRDLGLYLEQEVDTAAGPGTITYLQATTAGDRPPWIAPIALSSEATAATIVGEALLSCNFTYISTPSYVLAQILKFSVGGKLNTDGETLNTNRTIEDTDSNDHPRAVSSIVVTEIRGA